MNCLSELEKQGHNVSGYSPDTYYYLVNADEKGVKSPEECKKLLGVLEYMFG